MENNTTIIAIGDQHFTEKNTSEVNMFTDRLEKLCLEKQPDLIVLLGDLLHTHERLHTSPLNQANVLIDKLRNIAHVVILVGNHDAINNQIFLTENHWLNFLKRWDNVTVVDTVIEKEINNFKFVFCPYVPVGRFEEALNCNNTINWKNANTIFCHQEFYGCKMGAIISVEGDKWLETYPSIVSGHIHSNQTIKNIYYPGSSMQHAFGESERNVIAVLTFTNTNIRNSPPYILEEVDLELPRKKILYTDMEKIDDLKLPQTQDKIKISISGSYDEFKAFKRSKKYKELTSSGTKVVFKPKKNRRDNTDNNDNNDNKDNKENINEITEEGDINFLKILASLIYSEKNPELLQTYDLIIHNRESSDVIFIEQTNE